MKLPIHQNPSQEGRTASAPYNFVPLPEKVVTAVTDANELPDHDRYYSEPERYSGKIKVMLETSSPLYIRAPLTIEQFQYEQEGRYVDGGEIDNPKKPEFRRLVKNIPEFFYTDPVTCKPVIPGSSLRGMLRNLLEIVSFSKIQWVTNGALFYRNVRDRHYRTLFTSGSGDQDDGFRSNVEGGFWKRIGEGKYRIEKCTIARIELSLLRSKFGVSSNDDFYDGQGPNASPKWQYQHERIWVKIGGAVKDYPHSRGKYLRYLKVENLERQNTPGHVEATLVLTGLMINKKMAFAFIPNKSKDIDKIDFQNIPESNDKTSKLVDLFHSDEQITQWQESAFPQGKSKFGERQNDGYLADGEPVFFLRERGRLKFFGRAQLFRLPYDNSPFDMVPEEMRRPEDIDFAEALFGFVRTKEELDDMKARGLQVPKPGDKGYAYASRVFVTDATVDDAASVEQLKGDDGNAIVPPILATPKPTSYQLYLVQEHSDDERQLYHYNSRTVIRGFKRYWFKGERQSEDLRVKHPDESEWVDQNAKELFKDEKVNGLYVVKERNTQLTQFKPIKTKKDKVLTFHIHFENLRDYELGALLWVLELPGPKIGQYRHSLGMGKPLGMGAVKLTPTLFLSNRKNRYQHLFKNDDWELGTSKQENDKQFIETFERFVLDIVAPDIKQLHEVDRIKMLLTMLEWPGPKPEQTRYLLIKNKAGVNEYSNRPVLPDPSAFGGLLGAQGQPESDDNDAPDGSTPPEPKPVAPKPPKQKPASQQSTKPKAAKSKSQPPQPSQPQPARAAQPSPLSSPAPAGFSRTKKEWVTVVKPMSGGKAKVKTEQGDEIVCESITSLDSLQAGQKLRANVTYDKGKAVKAVFKGWK